MLNFTKTFLTDESGATAIEYGLIAALVSVAAIATLEALGTSLTNIFGVAQSSLNKAATSAGGSS
ncbi:Flp family type IVb pilin [uncultured Kiloniella sp.]|uniref:Flp family type IVb pilin n=1 Tax=uncultured Kiloniella sp. TaxID=1133091 RepID=UPI002626C70C|nr:Flp family type IVb pilin [uncultured Kiloniella sp.]